MVVAVSDIERKVAVVSAIGAVSRLRGCLDNREKHSSIESSLGSTIKNIGETLLDWRGLSG
jgi:ethanolamine utilization microcompartment shell protein EutS